MPTLARRVEPPRMHICHVATRLRGRGAALRRPAWWAAEALSRQPTAVSRSGLGISAPHIFSSA
jgi:hypothetical protein